LAADDIYAEVVDARFVKPLDTVMLDAAGRKFKIIITVEDGIASGGFGSAVNEYVQNNIDAPPVVRILGLPDKFLKHGKRSSLLKACGLDAAGIAASVRECMRKYAFK
jgi:1-deoxy-D-xylulose-5-phosphate synthase